MHFAKSREEAHKRTINVNNVGGVWVIEISSWSFPTPRKRFADTEARMKYIVDDENLQWHPQFGEVETTINYL